MKTSITAIMLFAISVFANVPHSEAARFRCRLGNAVCLITSMNTANAIGGANIITLEPGIYNLPSVNNDTDGPNGLPSVTGTLTIRGAGDGTAIIARQSSASPFRIFHIGASGSLTVEGLIISGGAIIATALPDFSFAGAGILNRGTLTFTQSTLSDNLVSAAFRRRGIGAGLVNDAGTVLVLNSTVTGNRTEALGGGIANNGGTVFVLNSTIARNSSFGTGGAGFSNFGGTTLLLNSTVTNNSGGGPGGAGGIHNDNGTVTIANTLLAGNNNGGVGEPDCSGRITSLGNNLIGSTTGCNIVIQPSDLAGQNPPLEPGLGDFADADRPGLGHVPLLPGSPAINAGNNTVCPRLDQLGGQRAGGCDIGAFELLRLFRGNPPPLPQ